MSIDNCLTIKALLKRLCAGLGFVLAITAITACAQEKYMTLELKDVQFFQVEQIRSSPAEIRLSGLVFHSSLAILNITSLQTDKSLQVLVHLAPATAGLSGNLDYTVAVPNSVETVTFGAERTVIWTSSAGAIEP